ncbi:MAG: hypothetical protein GEU28_04285 [Dehalococcoidia bacterium]|nr:hypothetical protein [Dehalococcoidia bacterium]
MLESACLPGGCRIDDSVLLLLLAFSSFGAATGVYFFNDKLERMLNAERLPPLRWVANALALFAVVLVAAAAVVAL